MKIRTQFITTTIIFGSILLIIAISFGITNQKVNKLTMQQGAAVEIVKEANELSFISNDYLIYREKQQLTRWESKFSSLSNNLSNLGVSTLEQQALVNNLQSGLQRFKTVFADVRSTIESASQNSNTSTELEFMRMSWSRMEVQTQGMVFDASELLQSLDRQEDRFRNVNNLLIFTFIGVFGVFISITYVMNYRRTLNSISELQSGTKIIGSGNLDYSITEKHTDEFGELARAFNRMTANLKDVTASKADLEREIAERRKAEEIIRYQSSLVDSISTPMLSVNLNMKIVSWNKAAEVIYGWSAKEAIGNDWNTLLNVEYPDIGQSVSLEELFKTGHWSGEVFNRKKNGERFPVLSTRSVLGDDAGKPVGIVIAAHDITELKKAEQLKDEFIGLVSHELKNPLTIIIGALSVASLEQLTRAQALGLIQDAVDGAESLSNIIDNFLELSRYQANRLVLQTKLADVRQIALDVTQKLSTKSTTHHLTVDIPQKIPLVTADQLRVERIIYNLLDNAIKYSPAGGEVKIFALPDQDHLLIGVRDNGIGISQEDQAKLFLSFQRLGTANPSIKGIGLGLRVCRILVEAHGGKIWAESEPGKGSTFFFSLPVEDKTNH